MAAGLVNTMIKIHENGYFVRSPLWSTDALPWMCLGSDGDDSHRGGRQDRVQTAFRPPGAHL